MRIVALALTLLLVSACAPTSQVVNLAPTAPEATAADQVPGAGRLALEVVDSRRNSDVGTLVGSEGKRAPITAAHDIAYTLQLAVADALSKRGFDPAVWSDDAEPRLLVEIEKLNLTVDDSLPRNLTTEVVLKATAWHNGQRYTSSAQSTIKDRMATRPSAETSATYLNNGLSQALDKLLAPKLMNFLGTGR